MFVARWSGGAHRLTHGTEYHSAPAWGPSGHRLAVRTPRRIVVLGRGGRVRHEIRGGTAFAGPPAWARDGSRIAFVSYHRDGRYYDGNLVVSGPDGGGRRIVARHADGQPDWSPDGRTLFYRGGRFGAPFDQRILAVARDGGAPRLLASSVWLASRVAVSPDGRRVLYLRDDVHPSGGGLWAVRTDGGGRRHLIGGASFFPASYGWAFTSGEVFAGVDEKDRPRLVTLSRTRRSLRARTTPFALYDLSAGLRRVAWYVEYRGRTEIWGSRSDGTGRRLLVRFRNRREYTDVGALRWSPDGTRLAVEAQRHSAKPWTMSQPLPSK
ncbi:MAG: TolB family protein [Thermoleophilaceae bacterium]